MIELHNRDCMEAMKEMHDKAFDLAIVDPPYGIGADNQKASESYDPINGGMRRRLHWSGCWDSEIPTKEYFEELERISKNRIVWGGNFMTEFLPPSRCWLIWDKVQEFSGSDFEMAWTSFNSASKAFRMQRIMAYSNLNKTTNECTKIHPTQKPVKLYEWILKNYAKEGDKILDTHLGSGSIAIACYNLGYSLTGYEIDKDYYEAAMKRLEEHKRQGRLFDAVSV